MMVCGGYWRPLLRHRVDVVMIRWEGGRKSTENARKRVSQRIPVGRGGGEGVRVGMRMRMRKRGMMDGDLRIELKT